MEDLAPESAVDAASDAALGSGAEHLSVHFRAGLAAFTDGARAVVAPLDGAPGALVVAESEGGGVVGVRWSAAGGAPLHLAVVADRDVASYSVMLTAGGTAAAATEEARWGAGSGDRFRAARWCPTVPDVCALLGSSAARVCHVGGPADGVALPGASGKLGALVWAPDGTALAAACGQAEVRLWRWRAAPGGGAGGGGIDWGAPPGPPAVILPAIGGTLRALAAAVPTGTLVLTADAPLDLREPPAVVVGGGAPDRGAASQGDDGDAIDLRNRIETVRPSSAGIPSIFMLPQDAAVPGAAPGATRQYAHAAVLQLAGGGAGRAGNGAVVELDKLPASIPDILRVRAGTVYIGSSTAATPTLLVFALREGSLVPLRAVQCGGAGGLTESVRIKGLALGRGPGACDLIALLARTSPQPTFFLGGRAKASLKLCSYRVDDGHKEAPDAAPSGADDPASLAPEAAPEAPATAEAGRAAAGVVDELRAMLAAFQAHVDARFDNVDAALAAHARRLDRVESLVAPRGGAA